MRALLARLDGFDVALAVEGHADDVQGTAAYADRLLGLRQAADLVEERGAAAAASAAHDEDLSELVGFLLVGEGLTKPRSPIRLSCSLATLRKCTHDECMARLRRFTKTERAAHWLVACAFGVMLFSGGQVPHRWTLTTPAFDVHVGAAVVLVCGLAGLLLFGNGRALSRTARELRRLDADDRAWLAPLRILRGRPAPPVGRFNAGQKMNARLALAGLAGLYATGAYLVLVGHSALGQLHGPAAFLTTALIAGHIFMAVVNPSTRHALRGMTLGSVDRDWAAHHFPRWVDEMEDRETGSAPKA